MATLIEALTPRYSEQASVLTGNPNRVTVEVEDNIDEEFWGDILRGQCPEKEFHFMTCLEGNSEQSESNRGRSLRHTSKQPICLEGSTQTIKVILANESHKSYVSHSMAYQV